MTYEYCCTNPMCNKQWEELQSIKEQPKTICPHCNQTTAKRLISGGTGFILNGGGWASDLYGSSKPGANAT